MKKIWIVARHEFSTTVKRWAFVFVAFGLPLVMTGISILAITLLKKSEMGKVAEMRRAGVVNLSALELPPPPESVKTYASEADARAAVRAGEIRTYVVLEKDYLETGRAKVASAVKSSIFGVTIDVPSNVRDWIREGVLAAIEDPSRRERAKQLFGETDRIQLDPATAEPSPEDQERRMGRSLVAVGFFFAMFMAITTSGSYLIQGLGDEKENRVMEMILSSIRPEELMAGKLLGLGAAGLLQMLVWASMGVAGLMWAGQSLLLEPKTFLLCLPLFMLGFLLLGSLMLGTGSLGSNLREATQWSMVWNLAGVMPLMFWSLIAADPSGTVARVLTYIPITTAMTLMLRYAVDPAALPTWELALGFAILIVSTLLAIKGAAKIYRVGLLMYGKKVTPREILRWLFA